MNSNALKSILPPVVYNALLRFRLERSARRMFPDEGSLQDRVGYVAYKYCLEQAAYFAKQGEWDNRVLAAGQDLALPVPDWLFPWHAPALKEIEGLSRDVRILDICCGIPTFLEALYKLGFTKLHGTDDNSFMPLVVDAAREYCQISGVPARIFDVRTSYAGDYREILKTEAPFDVITNFGVATVLYFPIVSELMAEGGLFISETYFEEVPAEFRDKFEMVRVYSEYGFRLKKFSGTGSVAVFRKKS